MVIGFILIALAIIIFFDPVMTSNDPVIEYYPEYIDTTYIPYVFAAILIIVGTAIVFSG